MDFYTAQALPFLLALLLGVMLLIWAGYRAFTGRAERRISLPDAYACFVVAVEEDLPACAALSFGMVTPKFKSLSLESVEALPRWVLIVWSKRSAMYEDKIVRLLEASPETRCGLLQIDSMPLPKTLDAYPIVQNGRAADIAWQWRVKVGGAPADHVARPA